MLALTALHHHRRRRAPHGGETVGAAAAVRRAVPVAIAVVRSAAGLSPLTLARLKNVETFLLAMGLFGLGTGVDVRNVAPSKGDRWCWAW